MMLKRKRIKTALAALFLSWAVGGWALSEESGISKEEHNGECRLRVLTVAGILNAGAINYAVDTGRLFFPRTLSEIDPNLESFSYATSSNREDFFLTCHHADSGDKSSPYPFVAGSKLGLSESPIKPQLPFSDFEGLSVAQFLGIPQFKGHYRIVEIGRYKVLAVKPIPMEPDIVAEILNPDAELKKLQSKSTQDKAYKLSNGEMNNIIDDANVLDPDVIELLRRHCER